MNSAAISSYCKTCKDRSVAKKLQLLLAATASSDAVSVLHQKPAGMLCAMAAAMGNASTTTNPTACAIMLPPLEQLSSELEFDMQPRVEHDLFACRVTITAFEVKRNRNISFALEQLNVRTSMLAWAAQYCSPLPLEVYRIGQVLVSTPLSSELKNFERSVETAKVKAESCYGMELQVETYDWA